MRHCSLASTTLITALTLTPIALLTTAGCEKKPANVPAAGGGTTKKDDHAGHDHGHGGAVVALGEQTIGGFTAKVTRDEGKVEAGKEAAFDADIKPAAGSTAKVSAVRFWVGTEDAKGSVKAKADIEDTKNPTVYHTHVEVPSPMPAGSKLWVEIEDDKGAKSTGSFDLKA